MYHNVIYLHMLKLKTTWFNKWAKKNAVSDNSLQKTIENLSNNLGTIDLGGGLYKVRTQKLGQGKSGGFRTIVVLEKKILQFLFMDLLKQIKII